MKRTFQLRATARAAWLVPWLVTVLACSGSAPAPPSQPAAMAAAHEPVATAAAAPVDFATRIQPIFESRCQPCHFPGGTMYEKLPFDRPETFHALGEKLFTRIKEPEEQALVRAFLAEPAAAPGGR